MECTHNVQQRHFAMGSRDCDCPSLEDTRQPCPRHRAHTRACYSNDHLYHDQPHHFRDHHQPHQPDCLEGAGSNPLSSSTPVGSSAPAEAGGCAVDVFACQPAEASRTARPLGSTRVRSDRSTPATTPWRLTLTSASLGFLVLFLLTARASSSRPLRDGEYGDSLLQREGEAARWHGLMPDGSVPKALAAAAAAAAAAVGDGAPAHYVEALHKIFPSNISGTYKGTWEVVRNGNDSSTSGGISSSSSFARYPDLLQRSSGNIIFQLKAFSTARPEVQFVHGEVVLRDGMYISDGDVHMKLEGVYVRTWGQLRLLLSTGSSDADYDVEDTGASGAYRLALHEGGTDHSRRRSADRADLVEMAKSCRIRMVTHVSPTDWEWKNTFADGVREHVPSEMTGFLESPQDDDISFDLSGSRGSSDWTSGSATSSSGGSSSSRESDRGSSESPHSSATHASLASMDEAFLLSLLNKERSLRDGEGRAGGRALLNSFWPEGGEGGSEGESAVVGRGDRKPCFATLRINATAVDLEAYYNKAVNYTLMVTFISFLQVLFIIRQMEHSNTQSGAAKVSMLMVGQQAIMDAYLCLLHLTAGIVVESLFNAFATAAFFKFVIFSIFEMRYLLAIWKARRPASSADSWELMRRELSVLYSRFYGFLLGGILLIYRFNAALRYLLLIFYSFWLPQIVTSAVRDARKPLHVHYILGISLTRLAIPLYIFGCPRNFMRVEPSFTWCAVLLAFMGLQVAVLLLQHYFGPRCFIPRQFLPDKYSYFRRIDCSSRMRGPSSSSGCDGDDDPMIADCVICMAPIPCSSPHSTERMVTPCDHVFHTGCLQRWMDIKMECPTCRRPLPPV